MRFDCFFVDVVYTYACAGDIFGEENFFMKQNMIKYFLTKDF